MSSATVMITVRGPMRHPKANCTEIPANRDLDSAMPGLAPDVATVVTNCPKGTVTAGTRVRYRSAYIDWQHFHKTRDEREERQQMKPETRSATVIDINEARKKRSRAERRRYFATEPSSSACTGDSVRVTLMNGTVITIESGDLSLEGVKLRTTEASARTLYQPGQFIGEETPTIEIAIDLPLPDGDLRLLACCRLVHFEMLSAEDVTFTLEFLAFVGAGEAILRHFLRIRASQRVEETRHQGEICAFEEHR